MSLQDTLDEIGYVAWHAIRVTDEAVGRVSVALPPRDDLLNYVGTAHAGALFTLAETAAGVAADGVAQTMNAFILLRNTTVNYTRRAVGELIATGEVALGAAAATERAFTESGRADLAIGVVIRDAERNDVFDGTFNYALRPRKA